jgi:NADPH-dependent 2,4-dienoyl-CoA reductase/sulfur reductase-like enzyme
MRQSEVLIVGAGPAGMAAAVRAAECGQQVTVVDDNPGIGGQIWRGTRNEWFDRLEASGAEVLTGCRAIAGDAKGRTLRCETERESFDIGYKSLIIAAGARELFLPFPGWTLPNVMGAGGLQALVKSGLPVKGKRVVAAGSGPLLLAVADYLRKQGAEVAAIVEQAAWGQLVRFAPALLASIGKMRQAAAFGLRGYRPGSWVVAAEGDGKLAGVQLNSGERIACDYLGVGYGLVANTELVQHLGGGSAAWGTGGVDLSIVEGEIAGYTAGGRVDLAERLAGRREKAQRFAKAVDRVFALRKELRGLPDAKTIVCRCEDVRFGQLQGCEGWRAAKLHTRCGMGPCQGRICGPAVGFLLGWKAESVRPPIFPARVGSLIKEGIKE